jgi:hypothetical protein
MQNSADHRDVRPDGNLAGGNPYVDITDEVEAALRQAGNGDQALNPGESVEVTDIDVFSRFRIPPQDALFALWSRGF